MTDYETVITYHRHESWQTVHIPGIPEYNISTYLRSVESR